MDIKELKSQIENKSLSKSLFILKYSDNEYLSVQYAENIAKVLNLKSTYIDSLDDMSTSDDIFGDVDDKLYIYKIEKLERNILPETKNLIVICKTIPDILSVDYIEMPKILDWQIEDYAKMRLPGVKQEEITWLCQICKYDIYRIDQECKKLELFTPAMQEIAFSEMNMCNAYSDLTSLTIFNYIQAMMKKDLVAVNEILNNLEGADVEPAACITLFHKEYRKLIIAYCNTSWKSSFQQMISEKQFYYYRKVLCPLYSLDKLIKIFELITNLDFKLKAGLIDYEYIVPILTTNLLV